MKTELAEAIDYLLSDLRGLPFHLAIYEGNFQAAVDAEIARPKKPGEKADETAIDAAHTELLEYRKSIIADLEVSVDYCKEHSLPHSAVLKLIEALEGGLDCPKPDQFLFDARVEIKALRLAIETSETAQDDQGGVSIDRVILVDGGIQIDGRVTALKPRQIEILAVLLSQAGEYVSGSEHGFRSREIDALPAEVRNIIDAQPGAGTRIYPEWLN